MAISTGRYRAMFTMQASRYAEAEDEAAEQVGRIKGARA
jgi:hypothetical protein